MACARCARGAISFGLVTIPVSLYADKNARENVRFHMLHGTDLRRMHNRWVDDEDHKVPFDEIVNGYEYEKDRYVVVNKTRGEKRDRPLDRGHLQPAASAQLLRNAGPDSL